MSCGEQLAAELRSRGHRVTPQRAVILETIAHMERHCSAQEVFQRAHSRLPGLNLATVYRTLDTLQREGLVDTFSTGPDDRRYSYRRHSDPHCHLSCRRCGRIEEVGVEQFRDLAHSIQSKVNFLLDTEHLTMTGICRACQETV
jgi:Fur family transcriptional regulator, ferric uptake regulator